MTNAANENEKYEPTAQQKKLLRLVYVMGAVFALLFVGLVGGLIWKSMKPKPVVAVVETIGGIGLDPAAIRQMALDGDRLALTTASELIVIDLKSRKVLLKIKR